MIDPLVTALLSIGNSPLAYCSHRSDERHDHAHCPACLRIDRHESACAAATNRLSAILAAAREIVAAVQNGATPQAIVALLVPNLADALAAAEVTP